MSSSLEAFPDGWVFASIEDVSENTGIGPFGSNLKVADYRGGGVPLVFVREIRANAFGGSSTKYIERSKAEELAAHWVNPGDLLVTKMGDPPGDTAIYPWNCSPGVITSDCLRVVANPKISSSLYLKYCLRADPAKAAILRETKGVAQQKLSLKRFRGIQIPIPPINEQRRIVAKIEALQDRSQRAREALEAVPPLLEKLRQSVLAAAFRGDLTADWRAQNPDVEPASELLERIRVERRRRWEEAELAKMEAKGKVPKNDKWKAKYKEPVPPDTSDLPELPSGWVWVSWGQVGFCQNGRAFPSREYSREGMKLLRPGNLYASGMVQWTEKNTRYMPDLWPEKHPDFIVRGNELVINLTAQSLKDEFLGRVCLTSEGDHCLLNQRLARLIPATDNPSFFLWLFKSPLFRRYVDDGLNSGSLIQHMFTSQVDNFVLPLPPTDEQEEIVETIKDFWRYRRRVRLETQSGSDRLEAFNKAILQQAFQGKLVSQDPSDEPAKVLLERIRREREAAIPKKPVRRRKKKAATS